MEPENTSSVHELELVQDFQLDPNVIEQINARLVLENSFLREIPIARVKAHLQNVKIVVMGPSGSGKSTLIEALTGIENTSKSDLLPGRFGGDDKTKDFCTSGWRLTDTEGFENWGDEDFLFLQSLLCPKEVHEMPAAVIYCHRASQRLTGADPFLKGEQQAAADSFAQRRFTNECRFLRAISDAKCALFYVITDIYGVGDKLPAVVRDTNAIIEKIFDSKVTESPSTASSHALAFLVAQAPVTVCYVNTVAKVTKDLITQQTAVNGPVGIDDLRLRLAYQAPLRYAQRLLGAIDSRPWYERLFQNGALQMILYAGLCLTTKTSWDMILKSLLNEEAVVDSYKNMGGLTDKLSIAQNLSDLVQKAKDIKDRSRILRAIHELLPTVNWGRQNLEGAWKGTASSATPLLAPCTPPPAVSQ